jgi:hypothetical protein
MNVNIFSVNAANTLPGRIHRFAPTELPMQICSLSPVGADLRVCPNAKI